ncbi:unnamed protein product [Candidula unifasciata]|uniref:PH domain-containing protein n=1 Tax=Candidula unifasciata TaxID=100452 RepID=A0A8S3YMF7_9EUPU|nr:unnamed protein product [Candidula unifasciata]
MDTCEVINVADGREPQYNVTVRNAWKLRDSHSDKWYLLVAKTTVAKQRWLKAFQDERKRVKDDTENNFNIPFHVKQAVITNFKQKNTIQKPKGKGHLSRANTAEVINSINRVNAIATLPRTKNRHKVKSEAALDTSKIMKWFFFGKGKT